MIQAKQTIADRHYVLRTAAVLEDVDKIYSLNIRMPLTMNAKQSADAQKIHAMIWLSANPTETETDIHQAAETVTTQEILFIREPLKLVTARTRIATDYMMRG